MARKLPRPARTLVVFFVGLAIAFGLVALAGSWTPRLGLDLQGGTRITPGRQRRGRHAGEPRRGRQHHRQRVNGIRRRRGRGHHPGRPDHRGRDPRRDPSRPRRDGQAPGAAAVPGGGLHVGRPRAVWRPAARRPPQAPQQPQRPRRRRHGAVLARAPTRARAARRAGRRSSPPMASSRRRARRTISRSRPSPDRAAHRSQTAEGDLVDEPLKWMDNPDQASIQAFNEYECPPQGEAPVVEDDPDKPLVTCDEDGIKYLLSVSMIEGTDLTSAGAGIPDRAVNWAVDLEFDGDGTEEFTQISRTLFGTEKQFAIVLDGQVISAPTMNGVITNGEAQITGDFTEAEATSLATSLKFGALPIAFDDDLIEIETVGPSLAGNQLSAGLAAGALGLGLVMLYCLLYYRGLGLVVLASLVVAAALDLRAGAAAERERGLHADAARHRRTDRRRRHHRRLVHRLLRADPRRDARRQVDAGRRRERLGARAEHLSGRRRRLAAGRRRALHLRHRRGEGLRVRAGPVHADRPGRVLLVHPADGVVAGTIRVLQQGPQAVRPRRREPRHRPTPDGRRGPDGQVLPARQRPLLRQEVRSTSSAGDGSGTPSPA